MLHVLTSIKDHSGNPSSSCPANFKGLAGHRITRLEGTSTVIKSNPLYMSHPHRRNFQSENLQWRTALPIEKFFLKSNLYQHPRNSIHPRDFLSCSPFSCLVINCPTSFAKIALIKKIIIGRLAWGNRKDWLKVRPLFLSLVSLSILVCISAVNKCTSKSPDLRLEHVFAQGGFLCMGFTGSQLLYAGMQWLSG